MFNRRYEIKAVFDDADFGEVGAPTRKFFFKHTALREFDNMEATRRFSGSNSSAWHYELRDSLTNELIAADY